jgi:hypothetical protein
MKIFYAVQATGNGHIARAKELVPYLQRYGQVDVFLSGNNSNLKVDLPVKYQSNGVSLFYGNKGGLDYWKMAQELSLFNINPETLAFLVAGESEIKAATSDVTFEFDDRQGTRPIFLIHY